MEYIGNSEEIKSAIFNTMTVRFENSNKELRDTFYRIKEKVNLIAGEEISPEQINKEQVSNETTFVDKMDVELRRLERTVTEFHQLAKRIDKFI